MTDHPKMREPDNLCVVDSSFFVSSTAVNPTLTMIANAVGVAGHIPGRLGGSCQQQARPASWLMPGAPGTRASAAEHTDAAVPA